MYTEWTAVSVCMNALSNIPYPMALFKSLDDAIEYVSWVSEYDKEYFDRSPIQWITYIVEGDFINV